MILTLPEAWCSTLFTSDCSFTWPSGRAIEVTRCAITRCREIMTPQLSIVKTRFAKASLRPRCARHRSWRATCRLPNGCVGHSPPQRLLWSSSFPMNVTGRQAEVQSGSASITRQSARRFVSLIAGLPTLRQSSYRWRIRLNIMGYLDWLPHRTYSA